MYNISTVKDSLLRCSDKAIAIEPFLTELDRRTGDGDLGMSMVFGALAIKNEIALYEGSDIGELFMKCALALNKAAPSALGVLISGALMRVGESFQGILSLESEEVASIPTIMAKSIMMQGTAQPGDKTILDALVPLHETMSAVFRETGDIQVSARQAAIATKKGAKSTKGMIARIGRAKGIGDGSSAYPDGGAALCCLLMEVLVNGEEHKEIVIPEHEAGF